MSDEKTLLNDKFKKDEEKNSDIMDFSAAFNDDYDEPKQNFDEIGEPTVPVSSIFKSLPFFKKKKAEKPDFKEENNEVVEEEEKFVEIPVEDKTEEKAEDEPIKNEPVNENRKTKRKKRRKIKTNRKRWKKLSRQLKMILRNFWS
ncbi:MAG: hypothetical protein IJZ16_06220 [Clostridia bacterium]|nr:hypothetical protein [Clostridia bacterium]